MKKLFTVAACLCLSVAIHAQLFVEGQTLDDVCKGQYLRICEISSLSSFVQIGLDYGQNMPPFKPLPRLTDERDIPLRFNSITHALNVLYENGWELTTAYAKESSESYLLQRRKGYKKEG